MQKARSLFSGFSLIEMAIVLVVLGLLLSGAVPALVAQRDVQQQRAAEAGLREIREALLGYAALHGALPCPDADAESMPGYGEAETSCAASPREGKLPFKTLGLASGLDPWGTPWRYRVDPHFANAASPIRFATAFGEHSEIRNGRGEKLTASSTEPPVAVFFSLGPNARADGENASLEATDGIYQADLPGPEFDDRVHWLSRPLLFSRLIAAGKNL